MPFGRRLLFMAAKRFATDPETRRRAAEMYEREVRPRAERAWQSTRPRLEAARDELREAAGEADPRRDPRGFAASVKRRFVDRTRGR